VQGLRKDRLVVKQVVGGEHVGVTRGDSGSPAFWTNPDGSRVLVALYTAGADPLVAYSPAWSGSVAFCYRIDKSSSLNFIDSVLDEVDGGLYD
jgi:hypothetical protein